ncbi:MAG: DinB family protein [Thermoanaerobaculia bacterium]
MTAHQRLRAAIATAVPRLQSITDADAARPLSADKWSAKQVVGHLIDSASNNHQRFVRANFTDDLIFPGYDQERWVTLGRYGDAPWDSLLTLWREFNLQIARVMEATPSSVRDTPRTRHNLHQLAWQGVPEDQPATLDYFMSDYVDHLEHHLGQILPR